MSTNRQLEQRLHSRIPVEGVIQVQDINSGKILGNLANISHGGFMLISDRDLPLNHLFQLKLLITPDRHIPIGAESLWGQQASEVDDQALWYGFQIIDISDQAQASLEALLQN
jgi:hypothetical protein